MFKKIFIFAIIFSVFNGFFAVAETIPTAENPDYKSYNSYLEWAKKSCDNLSAPWWQNNSLLTIPQYPELSSDAVNAQIERTKNLQNISDEERARLQIDLDMWRIGDFSGFKTLEVARTQYRASMNSVFACGIISSRLSILETLREEISKEASTRKSEIQDQLDKEKSRLQSESDKLKCNSAGANKTNLMQEMINSSTRQYCHYRHYLSYLDTNLEDNRYAIEQMEKAIGVGNGTQVATTTSTWIDSYSNYANALDNEISRADSTLPRALSAYREMERAYPVHLMLTIIYDDFIRLRANLSKYMNASTQLYLKAFNAQDANNR